MRVTSSWIPWYTGIASTTLAALSVFDVLFAPDSAPSTTWFWAGCLGVGAGALVGIAFELLLRALFAVGYLRWIFWLGLCVGCAVWLVQGLGALTRLGGPYHRIAVMSLCASALLSASIFLVGVALQPTPRSPDSWLRERRVVRNIAFLSAPVIAAATIWIDRVWVNGEYRVVQLALRWSTVAAFMIGAAAMVPRDVRVPRRSKLVVACIIAIVSVLPFFRFTRTSDGVLAALVARPFPELSLRALRWTLDLDRDGYSALLAGGDCNDLSRGVNPARAEIPRNSVDDNCLLGDAREAPQHYDPQRLALLGTSPRVGIVLITVDAVSALHLSTYGYGRNTTPNIDRWARENAVVFLNAYSPSASTAQSFASIFRGVYPRRLRWTGVVKTSRQRLLVADEAELEAGEKFHFFFRIPLREWRPALPWWLERLGMHSTAIATAEVLTPRFRNVGDFATQVDLPSLHGKEPADSEVTRLVLGWLGQEEHPPERSALWAHYYSPHAPSHRTAGVAWFGDSVVDKYDHEIAAFDRNLASVLDALDQRRRRGERLAVFITSDHGDEFGARDRFHGYSLNETVVRVPLIVSLPDVEPGTSRALVSTLDILPTILRLQGNEPPPGLDGRDLRLALGSAPPGRIVLAETWTYDLNGAVTLNEVMATDGELKLTRNLSKRADQLRRVSELKKGLRGPNLIDTVEHADLRAALDKYLEEAGGIDD